MKDKKELIRVVRNNSGQYTLDFKGKSPGRGAYICRDVICFGKAVKSKGLERSFKEAIPKEVYESLREEFNPADGK